MRAPRWAALLLFTASLWGQDGDAAPTPLTTFAWPVPSAATVVETVFKDGQESKTRYRLTMTRREGGGIQVRYSDFTFLEVAGVDATKPAMQERLASATALASAIPDVHVRADGTFEAATGLEKVMDKVVDFLAESRGWSDEQRAGVRENMRSSGMLESLKSSVGRYWESWAGAWIGWTVTPGNKLQEVQPLPVLGVEAKAEVTTYHFGESAEHPGKVSLERRLHADGQKFSERMATYVSDLVSRLVGDGDPEAVLKELTFAVDEKLAVVTDPRTLVPVVATTERTVTASNAATDERLEELERHRYEFTWDAAKKPQ